MADLEFDVVGADDGNGDGMSAVWVCPAVRQPAVGCSSKSSG